MSDATTTSERGAATGATSADGSRRTVPGEYLTVWTILHGGIGAFVWTVAALYDPLRLALAAACLWLAWRATGRFAGRRWPLAATAAAGAAALLVGLRTTEFEWNLLALFSPWLFAALAAAGLAIDASELRRERASAGRAWSSGWGLRRIAAVALVLTFVGAMIVAPTVEWIVDRMNPPPSGRVIEPLTAGQVLRLRAVEAAVAGVFFVLGATIGSFLNVVVYRVPRGESVLWRRSHCPRCDAPVLGRDNIPVLGWLALGGRCRACAAPIAVRYPAVEGLTGGIFLLFFFVELISGGANLPVREPNYYRGVVWIVLYTQWDLVAFYAYHALLGCLLLVWASVDLDGERLPWRANAAALLALALPPLALPWLLLVKPTPIFGGTTSLPAVDAAVALLTGAAAGALLGAVTEFARRRLARRGAEDRAAGRGRAETGQLTVGLTAIGMALGWQAALCVWLATLVVRPVWLATRGRRRPAPAWTLFLAAGLLAHHAAWRWIHQACETLGQTPVATAGAIVALAIGLLLVRDRPEAGDASTGLESLGEPSPNPSNDGPA